MRRCLLFLNLLLFAGYPCALWAQTDSVFSRFEIQGYQGKVFIEFTVRGGMQCNGVRILRSNDLNNFTIIYEFPGVCGSPGSDENYNWTDTNPALNKLTYYLLEVESPFTRSAVRSVLLREPGGGDLLVYPIPCTLCNIEFYNPMLKPFRLRVYDAAGHLIIDEQRSGNASTADLRHVASGVHLLEIQAEGQSVLRRKILIPTEK